MATSKRDKPLTILFNDGYICPKCLGVGIGTKWKSKGAKYCPGCGQRIVFADLDEFRALKRSVEKIPNIMERSDLIETTGCRKIYYDQDDDWNSSSYFWKYKSCRT